MASARRIHSTYKKLLNKYGHPVELWPQWCSQDKDEQLRQLIAIGAILVQRTSWVNAEKALKNLRKAKLLSVKKLAKVELDKLTELIRVAGFYTTKPRRLQELCKFVSNNYNDLSSMLAQDRIKLREEFLEVYGIGPETADTLLLYALDKPSFIIDEYTKRFVKKYGLSDELDYVGLKELFESSLPEDVEVYQNYHVFMIADQKGKEHCLMAVV